MFNYGMKVSCYSDKKASTHNLGWHRAGTDITYYQNTVRKDLTFMNYFYTLSWTYTFDHDQDVVYFSYCIPYTYSDLKNDIVKLEMDPERSQNLLVQTLCKTLAGNECPILTITSKDQSKQQQERKKAVVLTARQHPGESVGSWMMRGAINFLTDPESPEA